MMIFGKEQQLRRNSCPNISENLPQIALLQGIKCSASLIFKRHINDILL